MPEKKDISDLLDEVQGRVQALCDEKSDLKNQVTKLESQLSVAKDEKTQELQKLQGMNAQLTKELQDTKAQLARELQETKTQLSGKLQDTQQKLDRFHPELQSLQDELQDAEIQNNLLNIELTKKNQEIKNLEERLNSYTSLALPPSSIEESII